MFLEIALPSFLAGQGTGLAIGFVAGIFFPGVLRKLRALFTKGKSEVVAGVGAAAVAAKAAEAKIAADIKAEVKKL